MQPQDALGAFTESPDRRFRDFSDASFRDTYLDNMRWEDKQLKAHMNQRRLAKWLQATFEQAREQVQLEADEATLRGAIAGGGGGDEEMVNGA